MHPKTNPKTCPWKDQVRKTQNVEHHAVDLRYITTQMWACRDLWLGYKKELDIDNGTLHARVALLAKPKSYGLPTS